MKYNSPSGMTKCATLGGLVISLLLIALHGLFTPAKAIELTAEERSLLQAKGAIVFVSQSNYPPFEFTDPADDQREGMMLDVVRWLAVELGFQPQFIDMSFQQAQEAVQNGRADVLTSLFHSEQRATRFVFTQPLFQIPATIFIRVDQTGVNSIEDLHGKTVAMQRGDYAAEFLKSRGINSTIISTNDFTEATNLVIDGQADAVIGDMQIVFYHIHKHHLGDRIKTVGPPLYVGSNCMAARIDNARLVTILEKGIDAAKRAGVLDKIEKKWFGPSFERHETFYNRYGLSIVVIAGTMLVLASAAWLWNMLLRKKVRIATELISRREQALRESEHNLRSFFESMSDLVVVGDHQGSILHCNNAVTLKLEYSRDELLTMNFLDLHPRHLREEAATIVMSMVAGTTDSCPLPLENRQGRLLPVETKVWHGSWGGIPCLFGLCRDLSKEQEALQRFNRLFHVNPVCLALTDASTKTFIEVNEAFLHLTGYTREEVIGASTATLQLFSEPVKQQQAARELMKLGSVKNIHLIVRDKKGDLLDGLFFGETIESQGQRYFLTAMIDQTPQKRAERLLRDSEAEHRRLFETMIDIFWRIDRKGVITSISPSATRITGYKQEELLGTDLRYYLFDVIDDQYHLISQMVRTGFVERVVLKVRAKNGSQLWLSCNAKPVWNEDGTFCCIEGIARDISEQKRTEKERLRLEKELLESQKKESLIRMAGATAHHFNNSLGAVLGYLELLLDSHQAPDDRDFLMKALQALNKAIAMGHLMFRYSGWDNTRKSEVDVSKEVQRLTDRFAASSPSGICIKTKLRPNIPNITINDEDLQWILNSIVTNATEAMGNNAGEITISTGSGYFNDKFLLKAVSKTKLTSGPYVYIKICDKGCGMDKHTYARIFDPFFSTKFTGRGLGLSLTEVILRNNHGGLVVETRPNQGTRVVVLLPTGHSEQRQSRSANTFSISGGDS